MGAEFAWHLAGSNACPQPVTRIYAIVRLLANSAFFIALAPRHADATHRPPQPAALDLPGTAKTDMHP
jgi:hypothetical protein